MQRLFTFVNVFGHALIIIEQKVIENVLKIAKAVEFAEVQ